MPLPNSLPWMESVDAKISRAHEHLGVVYDEIRTFLDTTKYNLVIKVDEDRREMSVVYWVEDPHPPIRLSTIIGDCVFNMRAALDNLVCGLIRTKDPLCRCLRRRFPIYADRDEYK